MSNTEKLQLSDPAVLMAEVLSEDEEYIYLQVSKGEAELEISKSVFITRVKPLATGEAVSVPWEV